MTVEEMISFRTFIEKFLHLISFEESFISSSIAPRREKASKTLDEMLPKLRDITIFYVRKFCNEPAIASNPAFVSSLRVDILEKVRDHTQVKLSKYLAKTLHTKMK